MIFKLSLLNKIYFLFCKWAQNRVMEMQKIMKNSWVFIKRWRNWNPLNLDRFQFIRKSKLILFLLNIIYLPQNKDNRVFLRLLNSSSDQDYTTNGNHLKLRKTFDQ